MARREEDKEDLMREATALVRRVEVLRPSHEGACVIGFRRDGAASVFFGADPVFQFNQAGELRRAFSRGRLVKADHGRLVWLERVRTKTEVQLRRRDFTGQEERDFLAQARLRLDELRQELASGSARASQQVPPGEDVLTDVLRWLAALPKTLAIAARPHAGGKPRP
jgi:hypothetical protein